MFSVTPSAATCRAIVLNAASVAERFALLSTSDGMGSRTAIDPTLTTRPHSRLRMLGMTASTKAIGESTSAS